MFTTKNANVNDGPTAADLAAIEAEWPLIAAELDLLDAEVAVITAGRSATPLDWRRVRRAEHRIIAVTRELTTPRAARTAGKAVA